MDWEGIPPRADWLREIYHAIDGVNSFVFVISPDSLVSEICHKEAAHAIAQNKRIVPIMHRDVDKKDFAPAWFGQEWEQEARQNWETLGKLNWMLLRETDAFQTGIDNLLEAISTDLEHVRNHTRWLMKAQEWDRQGRTGGNQDGRGQHGGKYG